MIDQHELVRDLATAFVLDALTNEEEQLVRDHLATCPEPHPEFAELGGVVAYLAEAVDLIEPPASLKGRILAAAAADLEVRGGAATGGTVASAEAPAGVTPFPSREERDARDVARADRKRPRPSPLTWVAGLAAVLVVAALGAWNVQLQRDLDTAREYQRGLSAVLDLASQPGSQTAILSATAGSGPSGLAAVASDGQVAIVMRNLAPTTGTEVYEAWIIGGDGQPVALGGFRVSPSGAATLTASGAPVEAGVTLALTREPGPGATAPSTSPVSVGKAIPPSS